MGFEVIPSSTTEARPTLLHNVPHLLRSSSSEDHLSCKEVSGIRSSPFLNGGTDSALVLLDNTSGCNVSASDNIVLYSNSGCCNLDVPLPHEKPKHAGEENGKVQAEAALTSFKVFLGLLTRTKDSIGCVTRIAIECGKLGLASEVCFFPFVCCITVLFVGTACVLVEKPPLQGEYLCPM